MRSSRIAFVGLVVLTIFPVACHRAAPIQRNDDVRPVVKDTAVVALSEDTTGIGPSHPGVRSFRLQAPGQRDSLRATLGRERELWRASNLRDYQFSLQVGCFCPGRRGWLLMEVRSGKLLRASDSAGKPAPLTDWNTFSIDGLFDHLERAVDIDGVVQIAFDPRWHFPSYVSTVVLPGPDRWSIIEARGLRPM